MHKKTAAATSQTRSGIALTTMKDPKLKQTVKHLQVIKAELSSLKPQVQSISEEYDLLDQQRSNFYERHREEIIEYQQTKEKIAELEESQLRHVQNTKELNDQLEQLSLELTDIKKRIKDKGKSMTDVSPLVDMRAAIATLREENQGLDIRLGLLYHELTKLRAEDEKNLEENDETSDDGIMM
jgi:chromosome segregation ATPase